MTLLPIIVIGTLVALVTFFVERQATRRKTPKPFEALQTWGQRELENEATKTWLAGLDQQETKRLAQRLTQFGRKGRFNIKWLLYDQFENNDVLKTKANKMASNYVTAAWQQVDMQADIEAHKVFAQLQKAPHQRKHRVLVLDLYARLIDARLTSVPSVGDTVRLSDRKKRKRAVKAIMQSAETNRPAFNVELIAAIQAQKAAKPSKRTTIRQLVTPTAERQPAAV